jgi:tetratricopeptide (TPR) repeat protein
MKVTCTLNLGILLGLLVVTGGVSTRAARPAASGETNRPRPASPAAASDLVSLAGWTDLSLQTNSQIVSREVTGSPELKRYAKILAESLPAKGAVVLSDDPTRLAALETALGRRARQYILLDTGLLPQSAYHRDLKKKHGRRLPELQPQAGADSFSPAALVQFLTRLSAQNELYYLHPSFGYFFEHFYLVPHGVVYEMKPFPAGAVEVPPLSPAFLQEQEARWQELAKDELARLKPALEQFSRDKQAPLAPLWVARAYSCAGNFWGVQLLVNQQADKAIPALERALELNPCNPCAFINLEWARRWKKTSQRLERLSDEAMSKLGPYAGNWDLLMSLNGPLDEPTFRTQLAQIMARNGLPRQAARQIQRVLGLNPQDLPLAIMLGGFYVQGGLPDRALELVAQIRSNPQLAPKEGPAQLDLVGIEARALQTKGDLAKAVTLLRAAQDQYPALEGGFLMLAQLYVGQAEQDRSQGKLASYRQGMTNAMNVFEREIKLQPNNVAPLVNCGGLCAQMEDYPRAISLLSRALELDPNSQPVLLNRALSFQRAGRLEEAQRDYAALLKLNPAAYPACYGLAEMAYQKQDWQGAQENYSLYLKLAPSNTSEYAAVEKRLAEVKKKSKP